MSVTKDWTLRYKMKSGIRNDKAARDILLEIEKNGVDEIECLKPEFIKPAEYVCSFSTTSFSADERIISAVATCSKTYIGFLFQIVSTDCATHDTYAVNLNSGEKEFLETMLVFSEPKRISY